MKKKLLPIIKQNRFYNPCGGCKPESLFRDTIPSFFKSFIARFKQVQHDAHAWVDRIDPIIASDDVRITWIGHATFLIQGAGVNIITDPIFYNLSPFFPRLLPPGITIEQLPRIDYVLISHNHFDHMHAASLLEIKKRNPEVCVLVPQGDKNWFDTRGFKRAFEYSWWDIHYGGMSTFHFLPAVHWSQRGLFDKNRSLWGSWLIELNGKKIYFAGDTAYGQHFHMIGDSFDIDIALMPIGPCEPEEWMIHSHLNGVQSIQSFNELNAKHFIPMHWGTFSFGNDHFDLPITTIKKEWHQAEFKEQQLHIIKAGQPLLFESSTDIVSPRVLKSHTMPPIQKA